MKCPFCNAEDTKVIDSRSTDDDTAVRRRRECIACKKRFTTYEKYETTTLTVIKKNNTREAFDSNKVYMGMKKSCEKRPVSDETLLNAVKEIEVELTHTNKREVESRIIGELIMEKLKEIDQVAYVRFASVYREFKDLESFKEEISRLDKK
ncbi:MAG: transcriptional regulator NrdR [Finegoldia sp.]|nr:transcriptional regulator NrdR [Finegoldia sp.]